MVINHNIPALNTFHQLSTNNAAAAKSLQKLSSGLRINHAADDAAGLAISEKMRGQISGLDQATRNAQDGISLIQTAEGALNETQSMLQRIRELAVQSASDTNTDADRLQMQKEVDQLTKEITRISTDTEFNTKKLLNGAMGMTLTAATNTAVLQNIRANGTGLAAGSYTLTMTAAGADSIGTFSNSSTGGMVVGDVTQTGGAQNLYGAYKLDVSGYNSTGTTANLTMTGPDGTQTTLAGVNVSSAFSIGGFSFAGNTHAITSNGMLQFNLSNAGVKVDVTGAPPGGATATMTPIASYTGQTLSVGGFSFTLRSNHGGNGATFTGTVTDNSVKFQIGANAHQNTTLAVNDMSASALGLSGSGSTGGTTASGVVTGGTSGSTNLVETDGAYIASTSITGTPAYEADGKHITLWYNPSFPGISATPAQVTCLRMSLWDLNSDLGPTSDAQVSISFDGGPAYIVTAADLRAYNSGAGVQSGDDLYGELSSLGMGSYLWKDAGAGPHWGFQSLGTGSSASVQIDVTGSSGYETNILDYYFGIDLGNSMTETGTNAVPPQPSQIWFNDGSGHQQIVSVNDTDTSVTGAGYFSGLTVNLASGKNVTNLTGNASSKISFNNVTTLPSTPVVSSVAFNGGLGSKITNSANLTFTYGANAVTISDGTPADNQTVAVTSTDTSFAVSSGNYAGMTVSLASGKTVSDLTSGTDGATISLSASGGGAAGGVNISTQIGANAAITVIDSAITTVSAERAKLGAMQNRLEHTVNNLGTTSQNLTASESQIRDVDMAAEMMSYTKDNILSQAATAMMAQANQMPQEVLQLLK